MLDFNWTQWSQEIVKVEESLHPCGWLQSTPFLVWLRYDSQMIPLPPLAYDKIRHRPSNSHVWPHKKLAELLCSIIYQYKIILSQTLVKLLSSLQAPELCLAHPHSIWAADRELAGLRVKYTLSYYLITSPHPVLLALCTTPYKRKPLFA